MLAYLNRCREFWVSGNGKLTRWIEVVNDGRAPEFGANLAYGS